MSCWVANHRCGMDSCVCRCDNCYKRHELSDTESESDADEHPLSDVKLAQDMSHADDEHPLSDGKSAQDMSHADDEHPLSNKTYGNKVLQSSKNLCRVTIDIFSLS